MLYHGILYYLRANERYYQNKFNSRKHELFSEWTIEWVLLSVLEISQRNILDYTGDQSGPQINFLPLEKAAVNRPRSGIKSRPVVAA